MYSEGSERNDSFTGDLIPSYRNMERKRLIPHYDIIPSDPFHLKR